MGESIFAILVLAFVFALGFIVGFIVGNGNKKDPFDGMSF